MNGSIVEQKQYNVATVSHSRITLQCKFPYRHCLCKIARITFSCFKFFGVQLVIKFFNSQRLSLQNISLLFTECVLKCVFTCITHKISMLTYLTYCNTVAKFWFGSGDISKIWYLLILQWNPKYINHNPNMTISWLITNYLLQ